MRCPTLAGERVLLRAWRPDELAWYVAARDEEVFRWTSEARDLSIEVARQSHALYEDVPGVYGFAVAEAHTDQLLGHLPVTIEDDHAEVAYWLAAGARGRGYLNDALHVVLRWLRSLGVRQATLEIHPENWPSRRAAERVGFEYVEDQPADKSFADSGQVVIYRADLPDNVSG